MPPEPVFHQVLVDVDEEEADVASGILFDIGATGLEERDATTLAKGTVYRPPRARSARMRWPWRCYWQQQVWKREELSQRATLLPSRSCAHVGKPAQVFGTHCALSFWHTASQDAPVSISELTVSEQ